MIHNICIGSLLQILKGTLWSFLILDMQTKVIE